MTDLTFQPSHQVDAESGIPFLTGIHEQLLRGTRVSSTMKELFDGLSLVRRHMAPKEWKRYSRELCADHPLLEVLLEDPLTRRAWNRPRGYPGDAPLIDFIYGTGRYSETWRDTSPLGREILRFTRSQPAAHAVRVRRKLMAHTIDVVAEAVPDPDILCLACGHLREAELSVAVQEGRIGRFVALDQDPESLALVRHEVGRNSISPVNASVRDVARGRLCPGTFDLIYAAGLYDYLPDCLAVRLTAALFKMLRPGGRILVANFLPHISDAGYMEAFMRWNLIYRSPSQMKQLTSGIVPSEISYSTVATDVSENIVFLHLGRRAV